MPRRTPGATLIVTGGNGTCDEATEAAVMRNILLARGIPPSRILAEDRSADTPGNFVNLARMVDPARPIVVVTSGYHMYRALGIAKKAGFTAATGLSAKCDARRLPANLFWEVVCEANHLIKGRAKLF